MRANTQSLLKAGKIIFSKVLLDNILWETVINGGITEDNFCSPEHKAIFKTIKEFSDNKTSFDMVVVAAALKNANAIGNESIIFEMVHNTSEAIDLNACISILKTKEIPEGLEQGFLEEPTPSYIDEKLAAIDLYDHSNGNSKKKSSITLLIEIGKFADLFHDNKGKAYATIYNQNNKKQTYLVKSEYFKTWLGGCFYKLTQKGASNTQINDALSTISACAIHGKKQQDVYSRIARVSGKIYIDLCNNESQVAEISKEGWQVLDESPVIFIKSPHTQALPVPQQIPPAEERKYFEYLFKYLNVKENDRILIFAWLQCALRGKPPYPILNINGEQGTGKTLLANILRGFIDPSLGENRNPPKDANELLTMVVNSFIISIDNVSNIDAEISDGLCRIATGGAISKRELYSDTTEVLHKAGNPIILNGITEFVTRPDLADRCFTVTLDFIDDTKKVSEEEMRRFYKENEAAILGCLYNHVTYALKYEETTKLNKSPRLVDCAKWVMAAETGSSVIKQGDFIAAYYQNIDDGISSTIEASPVAEAIVAFAKSNNFWEDNARELLVVLETKVDEKIKRSKQWADSPKKLSNIIKRFAPQFRKLGIEISFRRSHGKKLIAIKSLSNLCTPHTPDNENTNKYNELSGVHRKTADTPEYKAHTPDSDLGVADDGNYIDVHPLRTPDKANIDAENADSGVCGVRKNEKVLSREVIEL